MRISDWSSDVCSSDLGKETKLLAIGPQLHPWFDYAAGKIVWNELKYDPRYRYRDYSVINIYDTKSRKVRQLTRRSRLLAPAISADGTKIVAVKISPSNQNRIVLLDATSGKQIWESGIFKQQLKSETSRVGKECGSTCKSRGAQY